MTQARGYPHKQGFNVKAKPNNKRNAWYRAGKSNSIKPRQTKGE